MKYQESNISTRADLNSTLQGIVNDLLKGNLSIEGRQVAIPGDQDLDVKVKYATDVDGDSVTIKLSWENAVEEPPEED